MGAFVLMPFAARYDVLYNDAITAACADVGIGCERADKQVFNKAIVSHLYEQIRDADVVIAEVSEPNLNVYYEVGYARALGKRLVLLTRSMAEMPFDTSGYRHIEHHDDVAQLRAKLATDLRLLLVQSDTSTIVTTGFPWPALLHRAMGVLKATEERFARAGGDVERFMTNFETFVKGLRIRRAPDIQLTIVSPDRLLLFHDCDELVGGPAGHVGVDGRNIYDEICSADSGAVAWVDALSNLDRTPRARTNMALFRALGEEGLKAVVELHDELR
jgi:nucleoside 2-deoxyribosyltransferase